MRVQRISGGSWMPLWRSLLSIYAGRFLQALRRCNCLTAGRGLCLPKNLNNGSIAPNRAIVEGVRARYPDTPIIGFPKGAGGKLLSYVEGVGCDAIALDETVDPDWAARELPKSLPVQGNLDPLALIAGGDVLTRAVDRILGAFNDRPHVFNLGHGIQQDTPIAHVEALLTHLRS